MSQMVKFDRGLLQRRLGQPVRVADDYVDLPDILHGFDPTTSGLEDGLVFLFEDDGRPNPDFFRWVSGMAGAVPRPTAATSLYRGHRFPPEVIAHAVWLYFRFHLSFRDVQDLLAKRGVIVSHEAIRQWCTKFGATFAARLRQRRARPGDKWHLDEGEWEKAWEGRA
jgi:putative transposase